MIVMRPAKREEVLFISSRLRPEDRREIETVTGRPPEVCIPEVFSLTDHVFTGRVPGGDPCCLFGITPDNPGRAAVWLVATPEVTQVARSLVKEGREWLRAWSQQYDLHNIVDSRNELHLRWLGLMGVHWDGITVVNGHPFFNFEYPSCADQPQ